MLIYLTGYMGSGKSRYGRNAARLLDFGFIDLDELIEAEAGMCVSDIFGVHGEDHFRELERGVLRRTLPDGDTIISTGGGTLCSEENLTFMKQHGTVIYIRLHSTSLAHRLQRSATSRPLLKPHLHDLAGFVRKHLAEREPWYLRADLTIKGEGLSGRRLAEEIRNKCNGIS